MLELLDLAEYTSGGPKETGEERMLGNALSLHTFSGIEKINFARGNRKRKRGRW